MFNALSCAWRDFKQCFEALSWLNLDSTRYFVNSVAVYPAVCCVPKEYCLGFELEEVCSCCLIHYLNLRHPFTLLELE